LITNFKSSSIFRILKEDILFLVLLGPPGAGKGTQAERMVKELKLAHVASGDLFRENIGNETELGVLAKTFIDEGNLVPDDVTIAMVRDRIQRPDCAHGVLFDGFPRTLAQADGLDKMLADSGHRLYGVLYLYASDEVLIKRLSGRRICRDCQTPYHTVFNPPAKEGVCDVCGGELYQRDDDKAETVRARLQVYHDQTAPLIEYYRQSNLLREVDGSGDIETISAALIEAALSFMQ
jgi:adenylate kinase